MDENITITETPSLTGNSPSVVNSLSQKTSRAAEEMPWSTIMRYVLIIMILAFLGINLFTYLGKVTGGIADVFRPILTTLGFGVGDTVKQTVVMSSKGTKGIVDIAAGTVDSGLDVLEQGLTGKTQRNKIDDSSAGTGAALSKAVDSINNPSDEPVPDDAGSRTQSSKASGKAGYCYIGEDRGFRSCIKVNQADTCMSGDIFPSREICVNPNLRE
jgi:hypothetical protein